MSDTVKKNLGIVTAYGYARSKGYEGTEEEFAELMASYAEVAEDAAQSASEAAQSATNAAGSATAASGSAVSAANSATSASGSAQDAETAQAAAQQSATAAAGSATSASGSATAASGFAAQAAQSATSAAGSATSAQSYSSTAASAAQAASGSADDANTSATAAAASAAAAAESARTLTIDDTLTQQGQAADSKKTGDEISAIKADLTELEVETQKSVTKIEDVEYPGNLIDVSNARLSSGWIYDAAPLSHPKGTFYGNPIQGISGFCALTPYDADGNVISVTSGSTVGTTYNILYTEGIYEHIFDGTTITRKSYTNLDNLHNGVVNKTTVYTLSAMPSYWIVGGKPQTLEMGITSEPSETYVPYADPIILPPSYEFSDELNSHIGTVANDALGSIASATSNDIGKVPSVKSVSDNMVAEFEFKDMNSQFEQSANLIDETKFIWTAVGGYYGLEPGYYFPVIGGKKICASVSKPTFRFYDNDYTQISYIGTVVPYELVDVPDDAVYARMSINASAQTVESMIGTIMVLQAPADTPTNDYRIDYVPPTKIKGDLVEGDIYATAKPLTLDIDILTASQYKAVRAVNKMHNAFRIATFNIYVTRGSAHWKVLKQELKDHSIDICAMQEVVNLETRHVQNFLTWNTWQFKYGSQAVFDGVRPDKAVVSVYEIVSTEFYTMSDNRTYTKTVINLPQYKRNAHQFTLSVYSAHLSLSSSERLTEASEILATVANDASDFIVICMDSNTFKSEMDEHGKLPTWEAFISGGFTPIHYGEYSTITDMSDTSQSLDQIFMSNHITCIDYEIVNSNDYPVTISGSDVPISDHCMVYADLSFDFDAVLAELNSGN